MQSSLDKLEGSSYKTEIKQAIDTNDYRRLYKILTDPAYAATQTCAKNAEITTFRGVLSEMIVNKAIQSVIAEMQTLRQGKIWHATNVRLYSDAKRSTEAAEIDVLFAFYGAQTFRLFLDRLKNYRQAFSVEYNGAFTGSNQTHQN